jgi:hypothetical protein
MPGGFITPPAGSQYAAQVAAAREAQMSEGPVAPITPDEAASEEQHRANYEARVKERSKMTPEELTDAILAEWADLGVDVERSEVVIAASSNAIQNAYLSNETLFKAMTESTVQQFASKARTEYFAVAQELGLSGYEFPAPAPTGAGAQLVRHKPGLEPAELPKDLLKPGEDYHEDPDTGGVIFKNGVIVDAAGNVFYPPSKEVAGSRTWLNEARQTWDAVKIAKWKGRLADLGYLPREAVKDPTWNASFQGALSAFYDSKYENYGQALELDEAAGGYGAGGSTFENLKTIRATLAAQVRDRYRSVFGEDPTDGEVAAWTETVVDLGNKLQRRKGLSSGAAAGEAVARIGERLEGTPQAQFLQDAEEENTRLRDALSTAVVVTNSLAG